MDAVEVNWPQRDFPEQEASACDMVDRKGLDSTGGFRWW
jgi:hypothetical protein